MCNFTYFKLKLFKLLRCQNIVLLLSQVLLYYNLFPFHWSSIFLKGYYSHVSPISYLELFPEPLALSPALKTLLNMLSYSEGHQWLLRTESHSFPTHLPSSLFNKLLMNLPSWNSPFDFHHSIYLAVILSGSQTLLPGLSPPSLYCEELSWNLSLLTPVFLWSFYSLSSLISS